MCVCGEAKLHFPHKMFLHIKAGSFRNSNFAQIENTFLVLLLNMLLEEFPPVRKLLRGEETKDKRSFHRSLFTFGRSVKLVPG